MLPEHHNMNTNSNSNSGGPFALPVADLLRWEHGSIARIARELGVNRSTVSRVAHGLKTSRRVEEAVLRECLRIARERGAAVRLLGPEGDQ